MMRLIRAGTTCAVLAVVGGCASPFADHPYADWIHGEPSRWSLGADQPTHRHATLRTAPAEAANDSAELPEEPGPQDYVRLALRRNPSIRAAELRVQRLSERVPQVTSLEDPMFTVAPIGEMAETAEGRVELMTTLSQKLPTPGKLAARGRIAEGEAAMAAEDLLRTRLRVASDVRRAYWARYRAARTLEVIDRQENLLRRLRGAAEARYEAGQASQQEVVRATVEVTELEAQRLEARQQQDAATAMLNRLMDRPIDAELPLPRTIDPQGLELSLDTLLARASLDNPDLRRTRQQIDVYRQRLRLARLDRWPDLTTAVSYNAVDDGGTATSATGDDQWWLSFGINLPVWQGRRDAAEREAIKGIFESLSELTGRRNEVAFRVQDALSRIEAQQRTVALFRDRVLPQTRQALDAAERGYRVGSADYLDVMDSARQLLAYELLYHASVAQLEQDFADLQLVVGRELSRDGAIVPPAGVAAETDAAAASSSTNEDPSP